MIPDEISLIFPLNLSSSSLIDSLSTPLKDPSGAMGRTTQRTVANFARVASRTRDTFRSSDWFPGWIQQTIEHLSDRTVLAVERVGIHLIDPFLFFLRGIKKTIVPR